MTQPTSSKLEHSPQLIEASLIDVKAVEKMLAVSRRTIYERVQEGRFPAPIRLSSRCSRWRFSDVRDWIAQQASGAAA